MSVRKAAAVVLALTLFSFLPSPSEAAHDEPTASVGSLHFTLDTAGFRQTDGETYQEVYVLIDTGQLRFLRSGDRLRVDQPQDGRFLRCPQ